MEKKEKQREPEARIQQGHTSEGSSNSKQVSLEVILERQQKMAFDHPRARHITKLVGEMIAVNNQPFSVVSDVGFTRLMNYIEPRYCIPSRTYFSEKMIPQLFERLQTVVHELLDEQEYVSCTTDIWLSPSQDSLLSLTAH